MIIDFNRYNGGGGSGTGLSPVTEFPLEAEAGTVVAYNGTASASGVYQYTGEEWVPVGVDDLSAYWTSAQTQSAITIVEDHLYDVEQVTASALTELHEGLMEVSGRPSPDMSLYTPTSGFSTINGSAITNGGNVVIQSDLTDYWTSGETKEYVDSGDTNLQNQINVMDEVVSDALNDLNDRIVELSGSSVDLSAYYTSAQTEDAISAATSGKADAVSQIAVNNKEGDKNKMYCVPSWNEQGVITGSGTPLFQKSFEVNGLAKAYFYISRNTTLTNIYAPTTSGNPGEILVSTGNGAPVWSAMTFPTPDVDKAYVDSAITGVQDQLDVIDEVIPAAIVDLNTRKVESTSVRTIWRGTQAEYDAITTKDALTLYIIL